MAKLRYRISDWNQLSSCLSNNSRDLHISVTTFLNDSRLNGRRIKIYHDAFGTLFACLVKATGTLLSEDSSGIIPELTPGQILLELEKFGFIVEYDPIKNISGNQLEFLMTIDNLGFDKIRVLSVWSSKLGIKESTIHIVVFQSKHNGDWLNSGYSPSESEFLESLSEGSCIDITTISKDSHYDWSWLYGYVGSIDDIIADYANNH